MSNSTLFSFERWFTTYPEPNELFIEIERVCALGECVCPFHKMAIHKTPLSIPIKLNEKSNVNVLFCRFFSLCPFMNLSFATTANSWLHRPFNQFDFNLINRLSFAHSFIHFISFGRMLTAVCVRLFVICVVCHNFVEKFSISTPLQIWNSVCSVRNAITKPSTQRWRRQQPN